MIVTLDSLPEFKYLTVSVISAYVLYRVLSRERRNVPPGPRGLPFLGYIPFLSKYPHRDCQKLAERYGPVFTLQLGPNKAVIINDYENACEALGNEIIRDRPESNIFSVIQPSENLATWRGERWREHRRFVLRALRTVGVGKTKVEDLILDEINSLCQELDKYASDSVPIRRLLAPSTSNVVMAVAIGERYDYGSETRQMLDRAFGGALEDREVVLTFTGYLNNFLPLLGLLLKAPLGFFRQANKSLKEFRAFTDEVIKKKIESSQEHEDLIGAYVKECRSKSDNVHFDISHVNGMISQLITAGSGTVKDNVEWALLYLAKYPDIQERVHKEIENVIGLDRSPHYSDRQNMPYMQAFINETMRKSNRLPINIPHAASEDTTIGGYVIPKGYHVLVNIYAIHNDPKYWQEPEKFQPERFLSEDQTKLIKRDSFMPFAVGKRQCPGEGLAQIETFMYLANILQRFRIEPPEPGVLSDEPKYFGFAMVPRKLQLIFKRKTPGKS